MKSRLIPAVLTVFGLMAGGAETIANDKLALTVTPNVSNAPSTVIVRATVAKDATNRLLRVEADSGSFYRSSTIELDGDNAPSVTEFRFKSLPSGTYSVIAVLSDNEGDETVARRQVIVLSRFGEEP
jgi:hypothetical protein